MIDKERNMRVVAGLLGLRIREVFSVDVDLEPEILHRISEERGVECFDTNQPEGCCWYTTYVDEINLGDLLDGGIVINRIFPNSPLMNVDSGTWVKPCDYFGEGAYFTAEYYEWKERAERRFGRGKK